MLHKSIVTASAFCCLVAAPSVLFTEGNSQWQFNLMSQVHAEEVIAGMEEQNFSITAYGGQKVFDGHSYKGTMGTSDSSTRVAEFDQRMYLSGGGVDLDWSPEFLNNSSWLGNKTHIGYGFSRYSGSEDQTKGITLTSGYNSKIDGSSPSGVFGGMTYQSYIMVDQDEDNHELYISSDYETADTISVSPMLSLSYGKTDTFVHIRQYAVTNGSKQDINTVFDTNEYGGKLGGTLAWQATTGLNLMAGGHLGAEYKRVTLDASDLTGNGGTSLHGPNNGASGASTVYDKESMTSLNAGASLGLEYSLLDSLSLLANAGADYDSKVPTYEMDPSQSEAMHITDDSQLTYTWLIGAKLSF